MINQSNNTKNIILAIVMIVIICAIYYINSHKADVCGTDVQPVNIITPDQVATSTEQTTTTPDKIKIALANLAQSDKLAGFSIAKEINQPTGFINTLNNLPITISQYVGKKIILVDFWTYSCINCQRTTPYLNAWYDKYEKDGLIIIGVHTPEFDFEKVYDNVSKAVMKEGIKYPVVMDNNYATWTAYQNQYWPHKYLIDLAGYVVYDNIGEGSYDITEKKIQDLLMQRKQILGDNSQINLNLSVPKEAVNSIQTQSPETYFGSIRNQYLGNGNQGVTGIQNFNLPRTFDLNSLYLGGKWNILEQEADTAGDTAIVYRFNAKELYFVAGSDTGIDVEVLLDGKPVVDKGKDIITVSNQTSVHIKDDRLYHLIDLPQAGIHTLQINSKAGLKAFTFTFG